MKTISPKAKKKNHIALVFLPFFSYSNHLNLAHSFFTSCIFILCMYEIFGLPNDWSDHDKSVHSILWRYSSPICYLCGPLPPSFMHRSRSTPSSRSISGVHLFFTAYNAPSTVCFILYTVPKYRSPFGSRRVPNCILTPSSDIMLHFQLVSPPVNICTPCLLYAKNNFLLVPTYSVWYENKFVDKLASFCTAPCQTCWYSSSKPY